MAKMKMKKLNLVGVTNSWTKTFKNGTLKPIKKPLLYRFIAWLFDLKPGIKRMFLVDMINESNGKRIMSASFKTCNDEEITIETDGLYLQDLEFVKEKDLDNAPNLIKKIVRKYL
jgi:hypothetical protein